jgi:hypothetical protein
VVLNPAAPPPPGAPPDPPPSAAGGAPARAPLRVTGLALLREVLLPIAVVLGLMLIAVALIEGPPLEQFLYAVF